MPRVTIAVQAPLSYPTLQPAANALDITLTAADATNKQQTPLSGPIAIVAYNTGVGARTVTFTSVKDARNRTGDITAYSIGAGEMAILKFPSTEGWIQTDGMLYYEAEHAEVKFAAISLG